MPVDRKFGMLLSGRTAICERVRCSEDKVRLLLITGKPSAPKSDANVRMLAAEDLRRAWEMIRQGDVSGARSSLLGPTASGSGVNRLF